jgi:hypothetical protein
VPPGVAAATIYKILLWRKIIYTILGWLMLSLLAWRRGLKSVYLSAVTNSYHKYAQNFVLYTGYNSIVTNAVFPEFAQLGAFERLTDTARIIQFRQVVMQKSKNTPSDFGIKLV